MVIAKMVRFGIPKGSLQDMTVELLRKAGYDVQTQHRSYFPAVDEERMELMLVRPQEMPRYIKEGILDAGVCGFDWLLESGVELEQLCELVYAKGGARPVRWVLAVPAQSGIKSVKELYGKRIATELVNVTKRYLSEHGVDAKVEFSWGATEAKPPHLADAIVELTETGTTLLAHNLCIIDTVLVSTPRLVANAESLRSPEKREFLENLAILLKGALNAYQKVGLKMNIKEEHLEAVTKLLPALRKPTISRLTEPGWVAVEVVLDEKDVRELVPRLKRAGAEGIVEYSLNKVIY